MAMQTRLNILLTHGVEGRSARLAEPPHPWYETLSHLLSPLGVRTFEATTNPQAMALIEQYPIHLAVLDTRLTQNDGLMLPRLLERIRQRALAQDYVATWPAGEAQAGSAGGGRRVQVTAKTEDTPHGGERVEVRFGASSQPARQVVWPTVILVTPQQDQGVLQEALKCNAFSVMSEPVDLNLMLDLMARALRRFHQNQWPLQGGPRDTTL